MKFRFRRRWWFFGSTVGLMGVGLLALQCAPDDDTTVSVIENCDVAKLNAADPGEATVKAYVETATALRDRSKALIEQFKIVCNAVNTDLGLPPGEDVHLACNTIAERIQKANGMAPKPAAGSPPVWASVTLDDRPCPTDEKAVAACLDSCSGATGCNPSTTCSTFSGTCPTQCTGTCAQSGSNVACRGGCFGACTSPDPDGGPEGGVPACAGECNGTCKGPSWLGRCSTGCTAGFVGQCNGVCRGSCDAIPFPFDAGPDASPDGAADGGADADPDADAGPPQDAAPEAAPNDAGPRPDAGAGTCAGTCTGRCDNGEASGSCGARCTGQFAGTCAGPNCVGVCTGVGVPCVAECTGTCEAKNAQCPGSCTECDGPLQNGRCVGTFACGQPNPICKAVCDVKGAISAKCEKVAFDVRIAGDYKLYDALKAHMADFSALVQEVNLITGSLGGVLDRTVGDFRSIGIVYDNPRLCATNAQPVYEEARKSVNEAVGASLVIRGQKF